MTRKRRRTGPGLTRRGALVTLAGAAGACGAPARAPRYNGAADFRHGVASGDPGPDRVVIWTRITPLGDGPVPVRWIVARDRDLKSVLKTGEITTTAERDFTVKIDVTGLAPDLRLYYGFLCANARSPVGRTRTLARSGVEAVTFGVVSCANHPFGFFNAYEALARRREVDVVLHLGDYLYEYGLDGYGGDAGIRLARLPRPQTELLTLADYRARHAQYKEEPELQALHAACPWIVVWDDHEVANDSWTGGAENHNPGRNEGAWETRRDAALQAYYEWMPIRDPAPGAAFAAINRSFQFGDLATLVMLETRLLARTQQLNYQTDLTPALTAWDFTDPKAPRVLEPGEPRDHARYLPTAFDMTGAAPRPIHDWRRVRALDPKAPPPGVAFLPDLAAFRRKLADPARTLLGPAQRAWLAEKISSSRASGTIWQVLGNQTVMGRVNAPDMSRLPAQIVDRLEALRPGTKAFLQLSRPNPPLSLDSWDGYPAERARVLDILARADANAIVLSGDSHDAWAIELPDDAGKVRVGVEFATTAVTSPGTGAYLSEADVDIADAFEKTNRDVKWMDPNHRGFLVLTLRKTEAVAEFFAVSTIEAKDYTVERVAAFRVTPERGAGVGPIAPLPPEEPPKAP